jgi:hypothetical protein
MPHLSEFTEYKRKVVNLVLNDEECVELITGVENTTLPAISLVNTQVFPYDYIDETTTDAKVFVCVEVDEGEVKGPAVGWMHLWVYVAVPKSMMNMDGEIRRDALAQRIDKLLNGNRDFGFGKLERKPGGRIVLHDSFRGRFLHYHVRDWNRFCSTLPGTTSES